MKKEIIIDSRTEELVRVSGFIRPLLAGLPLGERERASVEFCLMEAVINAIRHGNGDDPSKKVRVVFESVPDRVALSVTDEGRGFDPAAVGDPRDPARIAGASGRGIFFMRQMMSSVSFEFSDQGTTVRLEKIFNGFKDKD